MGGVDIFAIVLMGIGGYGGYTGHAEVPGRDGITQPLDERKEIRAQAGVHVAEHASSGGESGDFGDRVDHAEGVAGRGSGDEDRVLRDRPADGVDIGPEVGS